MDETEKRLNVASSHRALLLAIERQISKSNTPSLPQETSIRELSDECLILKTLLNRHITGQGKANGAGETTPRRPWRFCECNIHQHEDES